MKHVAVAAAALIVLAFGQQAAAQSLTLTVTPAGPFTFQPIAADPETVARVHSPELTLTWDIKGGGAAPDWTVAVRASGDLASGPDTVPVTNISWTGTGGLSSGTSLTTSNQPLIRGTGKGTFTGTVTFYLLNLWSYKAVTYTTTIIFTISSP